MIESISDILKYQVEKNSQKIAVYNGAKTISYKQLDEDVSRLAFYLDSLGFKFGNIVFHHFDDEYLTILATLASAKIGVTFVALPTDIRAQKLQELQMNIDAKYLLSDISLGFDDIVNSFVLKYEDFSTLQRYKKEYKNDPSLPWQIVIGSGTTAKEKIFEVSQSLELQRVKIIQSAMKKSSDDKVASLANLSFNSAKIWFLATLYSGASYFIFQKNIEDFLQVCLKNKISVLYTTVFHIENILKSLDKSQKNVLGFLRVLSIGSSTVSETLKQRIKEYLTKNLYIYYGANEIARISTTNTNTIFDIAQTVGSINDGVSLQIVDEQGDEKTKGKIGHIRVKSLGMIKGYLNDEKNTQKFFKDGWFYPGDLGRFTKDGELIYCGRSDLMMIVNGINIYPSLIENRLCEHSDVLDAICVPFGDSVSQDIPICGVVLIDDSNITTHQLLQFCVEKLGFSSPKEIIVLDKIDKNSLGKIQRAKLKERIYKQLLKPTRKFKIKLKKTNISNLDFLSVWLKDIFGIDIVRADDTTIYGICENTISLIEKLLQIVQIPVVNKGEICTIYEDETDYIIELRVEYINQIPIQHYIDILNNSFKYIYKMIQHEPTLQNKKEFIDQCVEELLNPILSSMPQGSYRVTVLKEAFKNNIPYIHIGTGIYGLGWGSKGKKLDRSATINDSAMGLTLSTNKIITANVLKAANLPAPSHGYTNNKQEAISIAEQLSYPVVVKPADLERGEGVSVNIYNQHQLLEAFTKAYIVSLTKTIIIEKQVKGTCHRVFVAGGKVLYGVKRLPIGVYGDGKNSVLTLIDIANAKEEKKLFWEPKNIYFKDDLALQTLQKQNISFDSIVPKDKFVALRDIESTQDGGIDEDVTNIIHEANIDIALRASKLFELNVVGVDIITEDITKPWYETEAIINEVNYAPSFGGGDISKKHIKEFFQRYIKDDGRIPVEIFIGESKDQENIITKAKKAQEKYMQKGLKTYLLTTTKTYNEKDQEVNFVNNDLIARCEALLINSEVDALIVYDEELAFYKEYSPFDKVSSVVYGG